MENKESRISVRIDPALKSEFEEVVELTGIGETQFIKAAIKALIEYVREHGEVTLPLALLPKSRVLKKASTPTASTAASAPSTRREESADPPSGFRLNEEEPSKRATKPTSRTKR